jgi:hypothetical protein
MTATACKDRRTRRGRTGTLARVEDPRQLRRAVQQLSAGCAVSPSISTHFDHWLGSQARALDDDAFGIAVSMLVGPLAATPVRISPTFPCPCPARGCLALLSCSACVQLAPTRQSRKRARHE